MEFSYGQGAFTEGTSSVKGRIILSEHKLFLKGPQGDLTNTYVPLEKIEKIRRQNHLLHVYVRLSLAYRYQACFSGERKHICELTKDIVSRRNLKKKFLKNEWVEENN